MKKRLLVLVSALCMAAALLTACGGKGNLEEYYTKNKEAFDKEMGVEEIKASMPEGVEFQFSVAGDEIVMNYIVSDELLDSVSGAAQGALDAMIPQFQALADQFKAESGLEKAIITLVYQDTAGNQLASVSVEGK